MPENPEFGEAGGQKYPVLRSIQTFLQQMAEGGARPAPTVIKELLQNADDAGATEIAVLLDERERPSAFSMGYADLLAPALLVRNNAHFKLPAELGPLDQDDFTAICDVAGGHKRAQATAAGRFGIGFNSVYFLTDTPIVFSRREAHIFDLLHKVFAVDGWRFPLDKYPAASGSRSGEAKAVLDWCLPAAALGGHSFGQIALDHRDYKETIFRLPLRSNNGIAQALYDDRFLHAADRLRVLTEMIDEGSRSILFLKSVRKISFGVLNEREPVTLAAVEATPCPVQFSNFLAHVKEQDRQEQSSTKLTCEFDRTITRQTFTGLTERQPSETIWRFHVRHVARFDDARLTELRARLRRNGERAVPWVTVGVPMTPEACQIDGKGAANWRVFLPLLEEGPCASVLSGAFFVGPSRQRTEFRLNETDDGKRRTEWNQALVKHAMIELLQDVSADLPEIAPDLLLNHAREYVSLFPVAPSRSAHPANLTEFVRESFAASFWALHLRDIWGELFELWIGEMDAKVELELVPEWFSIYKDRFHGLSNAHHRFVSYTLGDAVAARIGQSGGIAVRRQISKELALQVLRDSRPPRSEDLQKLLKIIVDREATAEYLHGAWVFARAENNEVQQFDPTSLYVMDDYERQEPVIDHLRNLPLTFDRVEWVRKDVGLALLPELPAAVENVVNPTPAVVLELMRRLANNNDHDQIKHDYDIRPIVDFLVGQAPVRITPDLQLGFLVRTAHQDWERRKLGVILLKPQLPSREEDAFWEVCVRRVFARVDSTFSRELYRLLAVHPASLGLMHASDCRLVIARLNETLEVLHSIRTTLPDICGSLEHAINDGGEDAVLAANALLEVADASWDSLDEAHRSTVLALPIHRRSDGRFVSLLSPDANVLDGVREAFRLQSQDDIEDAPIVLTTCVLLQSANGTVKRFYRRRLRLDEHGRVAVLKDVLRQIGAADQVGNESMLQYVARYYADTLRTLEMSGEEDERTDARELRTLFASALTVPCIDGFWRRAGECVSAHDVAKRLTKQGWSRQRISQLACWLFHGQHLATLEEPARLSIERLHKLSECDDRTLASRAVSSENADFSLMDRVKVLLHNWADYPESSVHRSTSAGNCQIPVTAGREALAQTEFFEEQASIPFVLLRVLAPGAVDMARLGNELALSREFVTRVLKSFSVPRRPISIIDDRLAEGFAKAWPELKHDERVDVLTFIGKQGLADRLRAQASRLDTVLVATQPPVWRQPTKVVSPSWMETQPPYIPPESQPALAKVADAAHGVWREWAGIQTFVQLFGMVLAAAHQLPDRKIAAKGLYNWLGRAVAPGLSQDALSYLRNQRWFLAQRGEAQEFQCPPQVLLHPGELILIARFWVPVLPPPELAGLTTNELGFASEPLATTETLRDLAHCLVERGTVDDAAAVHVYRLVGRIIDQSESAEEWLTISKSQAIFKTFRGERRQLSALELFIGNADYNEDLSTALLCLKAEPSVTAGLIRLYRQLVVPEVPTLEQVLAALRAIDVSEPRARASYGRLVRALEKVALLPGASSAAESLGAIRVPTCAGTYEPISSCYWDEDFGQKSRVSVTNASRLVETTDKNTHRLVQWLHEAKYEGPADLRSAASVELSEEPVPMEATPELSYLLLPWQQWFQEAAREGSLLRERLQQLGLSAPQEPLELVPVSRIRIQFRFEDGQLIEQAAEWDGPMAIAARSFLIFVRPLTPDGVRSNLNEVAQIDAAIAREVAILLGSRSFSEGLPQRVDGILETLERPSTVLRRLRETYRQHFLHQYHDQVADPLFADLFEEYQRTVRGSRRSVELEERMHALLTKGFVQARREQIRGYGYDEFSVFTELMQNAEDAYIQRAQLGMDMPDTCAIEYRYWTTPAGERVLEVEHSGRPFNYWQHGARQNKGFSRDVEGVLRSAGSFKPHSSGSDVCPSDLSTIGRFGLGFKSVYLLTDFPEIHSGSWHFGIEAGCLPVEVPPAVDLSPQITRIRLPLRDDVLDLTEPLQLRNVLPFLQIVDQLVFRANDAGALELNVSSTKLCATESVLVEAVEIWSKSTSGSSTTRLLRCRSRKHAGQLALLLAQDGTPARWNEEFNYDLFAVLPLKARLGCGVAASNRFEVQSGRTHLVDPAANARLIDEVASLLGSMIQGLRTLASPTAPLSTLVARFWALWRWERGDAECEFLRKALARSLVSLADHSPIAPTLDPQHLATLNEGPCFYFYELPDVFRDALVAEQVRIPIPELPAVPLTPQNVALEGFAGAYSRACEYAGVRRARTLRGIGWNEVAEICRETPWFGERPQLLVCLASCLGEEQLKKVAAWVALCPVLAEDGNGRSVYAVAKELLPPVFPGFRYIPRRFLRLLSTSYDEAAVRLLQSAGLNRRPSSEDIRKWVNEGSLTVAECVDLLRYLAEDSRFREEYWDLASLMQSPWFPAHGNFLSTRSAAVAGFIPEDVLANEVFRAWLGLGETADQPPPAPIAPDPQMVLHSLFEWWQVYGASWTSDYESRLYPAGTPPAVSERFNPRDLAARREWISLFLLGALHTMGRSKFEQHRDFLRRCDRRGWFDVFVDPEHDARRWMHVLEEYLDDPTGRQDYYQWMKQFVVIFQVSRWLPAYVESILNVNRIRQPFALDQIIAPGTSEFFSGTDLDAPSLARALGMGASFVLRELMRTGILRQPNAYVHCYVAPHRVCVLLEHLGAMYLLARPTADRSSAVHAFLVENMRGADPTFGLAFDLPLLALAESPSLQNELLGHTLRPDNGGENGAG
jgi:hypothetical protein